MAAELEEAAAHYERAAVFVVLIVALAEGEASLGAASGAGVWRSA